jgi:two-component system, OmpR family, response regulator
MRLLLVEDDADLAAGLRAQLEKAGYAVDWTGLATEADWLLKQEQYEAVILDLGLPDQPGLTLLQSWRQKGYDLPVLILTARGAWFEKVAGFKAGADDYLAKPFHSEELLARLQALLRRHHKVLPGQFQLGDLQLDELKQSVQLQGQSIALTGQEFRLLRVFMLHPGQILSKSQLAEQLYDLDQEVDSNTLEVFIARLRQKIGKERIQTRRGQGYCFDAKI